MHTLHAYSKTMRFYARIKLWKSKTPWLSLPVWPLHSATSVHLALLTTASALLFTMEKGGAVGWMWNRVSLERGGIPTEHHGGHTEDWSAGGSRSSGHWHIVKKNKWVPLEYTPTIQQYKFHHHRYHLSVVSSQDINNASIDRAPFSSYQTFVSQRLQI